MSLSWGAYFGSHSTVSQERLSRAARLSLLVWIGPLSSTSTTGFSTPPGLGPIERIEPLQQGDEVAAALGWTAMHNQRTGSMVERADERQLARLARGRHPQIGPTTGPRMGQIRMGQSLGLVLRQQHDIARLSLLFQELEPEPGTIDRVRILSGEQAMSRSAPSVAVFFSVLLSCDFEIDISACRAISACSRGRVQFVRSATGAANNEATTLAAASLFTALRPDRSRARSPSTPDSANQLRQRRSLSGVTPNARAICPLVHPLIDKTIARARSASSRRSDRASSCKALNWSDVETTRGCPDMPHPASRNFRSQSYGIWHGQRIPA